MYGGGNSLVTSVPSSYIWPFLCGQSEADFLDPCTEIQILMFVCVPCEFRQATDKGEESYSF